MKVGWVEDSSLGKAARRLMTAHQFSPEGAVPCLGGDWLGALEHDGDEQWEMVSFQVDFPTHFALADLRATAWSRRTS